MRTLVTIIVLLCASVADARYCNSPSCSMCNRLFGSIGMQILRPDPRVESTPQVVVDAMLKELHLTPRDVLYDLGCGDGRILIAAVKQYGCMAVGIEIDPEVADLARRRGKDAGCGRIRIVTGDARTFNLSKATAVTMYLFPDLVAELMPKIKTDRVVSYSHGLPGRDSRMTMVAGKYPIYVLRRTDWDLFGEPKTAERSVRKPESSWTPW